EQQRVAIARALVHSPKIVWADEPTGALDTKTGEMIVDLLVKLKEDTNTTLVVVTHDERIAKKADRVLFIEDGRIVGERRKE
ncbi:MAG: ABC transporter ATP-binding protein, partial [Thermotoga sp.]